MIDGLVFIAGVTIGSLLTITALLIERVIKDNRKQKAEKSARRKWVSEDDFRGCHNCKHIHKSLYDKPCLHCDDSEKWEAKE